MAFKMSTDDRMVRSRVKLLMEYPFFGVLALHLKLKETPSIPTAATDGRYYFYNPKFVEGLDDAELNFLSAHEVLHPALGHLWRRGSRDKVIWNHAADYCINGMIKESDPTGKDFKIIKGALIDDRFKGMFSEEIYDILIKDEDYVKKAKQAAQGAGGLGNGGTLDSHDEWEEADSQSGEEGSDGQAGGMDNNQEDWEGRIVQASQAAEGKGKGNLPGAIKRLIKDLVQPQKNWKELLAEFVQTEINDYGWTPPNSHHIWRDLYLPDFNEEVDVVNNIVFAIDTSGSIGQREMRTFISECVGCMNQYGGKVKGWLIYCDAAIHPNGVYELEDAEYSVPTGGGGTDFRPVFNWIEDNIIKEGKECAGLCYLTDGYGDYPSKPPSYPVLWVLTSDYQVPWGRDTKIKVV